MNEIVERTQDYDDIVPINSIEERDRTIEQLQKALDESRNDVSEVNDLRDSLKKTKSELVLARKSANLKCRKIEFARKITEQRLSLYLIFQAMWRKN